MPRSDAAEALLRRAMDELRPVFAIYNDLPREFCPVALGWGSGQRKLFAWQYGGRSSQDGALPEWRCFTVAGLQRLELLDAEWRRGAPTRGRDQSCVALADHTVDPAHTTAKLPPPARR